MMNRHESDANEDAFSVMQIFSLKILPPEMLEPTGIL